MVAGRRRVVSPPVVGIRKQTLLSVAELVRTVRKLSADSVINPKSLIFHA
jgi:hypothetical protein